MNELQATSSWLDFSDMGEDAIYLRDKAVEYASIELKGRFEKGRILEEIHQKYANNKVGQYRKFCEKLKIPKSTADRDRKFYNYIVPNWDNMGDAPDLLNGQFDALASGKANPELAKAVESGEVKNSKEYKEMEKRLADSERAREQAEQSNAGLQEQVDGLKDTVREQADKLANTGTNSEYLALKEAFDKQAQDLRSAREQAKTYQDAWNRERENASKAFEMAQKNVEQSPKYQKLLKENETIKAHIQGKPLEQHAKETNQPELLRSKAEEKKIVDSINNIANAVSVLPANVELKEWAEVFSEDDVGSQLLDITKNQVEKAAEKLKILAECLGSHTGIRRIK